MIASTYTKINFKTLQLIRGIAAISVVFFHGLEGTIFFKFAKYGVIGVDLFFVLSGFIIFYVHYSDIGVKSKLKSFLIKRFIRIFPLYWLVTFIYIILVIPFGHSFSFEYLIKSILLLPQQAMPIIGVAWTLEYEILFYILFSLLILNYKKFYPTFFIWLIIIIFFLVFPSIQVTSLIIKKIVNPLNLEFLFGCGIALLVIKNKLDFKWVPKASILFGFLGICISLTMNYLDYWKIHRAISWGIPYAILIFGLIKLEFNRKIVVPNIFVYLGNASYSIYLTHLITLLVFSKLIKKIIEFFLFINPGIFYIISSVLAIIVGCFFHSFIERPLMKYLKENVVKLGINGFFHGLFL